MAIVSMTDAVPGAIASSAEYNKLIDNIQDLDARLGPVVSGSSASVRLAALEALTTNTSGAVGIGNQRLSDRLGSGVTNASTATAQLTALQTLTTDTATNGGQGNSRLADRFGTGVGTGTNVTTGSATSQLTEIRARLGAGQTSSPSVDTRLTALESAGGVGIVYTKRSPTAAVTIGTANSWTAMPFGSTIQGANTGITTSDSITFTLGPGTWTVTAFLRANSSSLNCGAALYEGTNVDPLTSSSDVYAMMAATNFAGITGLTMSAEIQVAAASTRNVRCSVALSAIDSMRGGSTAGRCYLTFTRVA